MAKYKFSDDFEKQFKEVCGNALSLSQAAILLKMNYKTVVFHAKRLNCFKTNQSGKGLKKVPSKKPIPLEQIFAGIHPTFQTHKLKLRILKEKLKPHQCESCGLIEWFGNPIPLELHHVDGNRSNNSFENLQLICPNCHALTDNYRAKNIKI
ncbi:MAG: HNH endonuclease signature motif containing protein [Spirosomataceae bacterium]